MLLERVRKAGHGDMMEAMNYMEALAMVTIISWLTPGHPLAILHLLKCLSTALSKPVHREVMIQAAQPAPMPTSKLDLTTMVAVTSSMDTLGKSL